MLNGKCHGDLGLFLSKPCYNTFTYKIHVILKHQEKNQSVLVCSIMEMKL